MLRPGMPRMSYSRVASTVASHYDAPRVLWWWGKLQ